MLIRNCACVYSQRLGALSSGQLGETCREAEARSKQSQAGGNDACCLRIEGAGTSQLLVEDVLSRIAQESDVLVDV
jgi:hypothetical protein